LSHHAVQIVGGFGPAYTGPPGQFFGNFTLLHTGPKVSAGRKAQLCAFLSLTREGRVYIGKSICCRTNGSLNVGLLQHEMILIAT
jgi:hypothetical protein